MQKKNVIIASILVIVIVGGIYLSRVLAAPTLKNFYVNQGGLTVEANNMEKVDVFMTTQESPDTQPLGTMELAEQNENSDQTWILVNPPYTGTITSIFAQGVSKDGKITKKFSLASETVEDITTTFESTDSSQAVVFGTVNSATLTTVYMNIQASTTITVSLVPNAVITNRAGQKILPTQLIKGGLISVTGDFTNELSFLATEVAEEVPQT